jgi:hypothetical protein
MASEPDLPETGLDEVVAAEPAEGAGPGADAEPEAAPRPDAAAAAGRRKRRRLGWLLLPVALALALVAAYRPLVRYYTLKLAREHGVVLTLGEVDVGWQRVTLTGSGFELIGVEGLVGRAESVTVRLDGTAPTGLEGDGIALELEGSAGHFALSVSEWSKRYPRLLQLPARGTRIDVEWRPQAGATPWLRIQDAVVEPIEGAAFAGGSLTASAATVVGIDVGRVGASWQGAISQVALGFGVEDLERAPVHLLIEQQPDASAEARISLRPTRLETLAAAFGVKTPLEGVSAHGEVILRFAGDPLSAPVSGTLEVTLEGYRPPVPRELGAFVFGDKTEVRSLLDIAADRRTVLLRELAVRHGRFELAGEGKIERHPTHATFNADLKGRLRCVDVADAAARARLGERLGKLVGRALRIPLRGSVAVRLQIEADSRDLPHAKVESTVGVGCGLKSLGGMIGELPALPRIELPELDLPGLDL